MNNWMAHPFTYPEKPIARGKVLDADDLKRMGGFGFARYKDVDGDGIPYRTLPGTAHPNAAYFTRGSGHNEKAQYSERPDDYVNNMDRLARKFETACARIRLRRKCTTSSRTMTAFTWWSKTATRRCSS
jgi:2-oxoglutarate ferredoxin oxidoreductase subunit alpha